MSNKKREIQKMMPTACEILKAMVEEKDGKRKHGEMEWGEGRKRGRF